MSGRRVIVIGAGMGGLAAALDCARHGLDVTVLERAAEPGGKARQVDVGGIGVDAGPTVFTMRWVFEALCADAGTTLPDQLHLRRADVLARHAWRQGGTLDLFADVAHSADAIGAFAGAADARGFRSFCDRAGAIYRALQRSFIAAQRPSPAALMTRVGWAGLPAMLRTTPFQSLWGALAEHFTDPRLRQLFGRYATYCGSAPMQCPATLMLVAHVEQDGVWLVDGGMRAVAQALAGLGAQHGARFHYGAHVARIVVDAGKVAGVELADGSRLEADAVIFNGDVSALAQGLLGQGLMGEGAVQQAAIAPQRHQRSLAALTWCVRVPTGGRFPLAYHNVFFAEDYPREFAAVFRERTVCAAPTVYVCAQDRAGFGPLSEGPERLLLLINAPPDGDIDDWPEARCAEVIGRGEALLAACGVELGADAATRVVTSPAGFDRLFPATGGALYGRANHGAFATFARSGAASRLRGLYLAGGSVHPGPGVPMATLSGRLAAARLIGDWRLDGAAPLTLCRD